MKRTTSEKLVVLFDIKKKDILQSMPFPFILLLPKLQNHVRNTKNRGW